MDHTVPPGVRSLRDGGGWARPAIIAWRGQRRNGCDPNGRPLRFSETLRVHGMVTLRLDGSGAARYPSSLGSPTPYPIPHARFSSVHATTGPGKLAPGRRRRILWAGLLQMAILRQIRDECQISVDKACELAYY